MAFQGPVTSYMSADLVSVTMNTSLAEVAHQLDSHRISSVPVLGDDGGFAGVVSRTDLLHAGRAQHGDRLGRPVLVLPDLKVASLAVHRPLTCEPASSLRFAARLMVKSQVHRLFVVDGEQLVGVISTRDLTAAVRDSRVVMALSQVAHGPVISLPATSSLGAAMNAHDVARTDLIIEHGGWPVAVFTALDALAGRDLQPQRPVTETCERAIICLPATMPMHHAAAQAAALGVARVIAMAGAEVTGLASGLDVARLVAI